MINKSASEDATPKAPLWLVVLAATLGGGLALMMVFLLADRDTAPPQGGALGTQALASLIEEIEENRSAIDSLRQELLESRRDVDDGAGASRVEVESADRRDGDQLAQQVERVTNMVEQLISQRAAVKSQSLRMAQVQNPVPNWTEVRALHTRLDRATEAEERHSIKLEWLWLTMEEVIRRLGSPTEVHDYRKNPRRQVWEYRTEEGFLVLVSFADGIVSSID